MIDVMLAAITEFRVGECWRKNGEKWSNRGMILWLPVVFASGYFYCCIARSSLVMPGYLICVCAPCCHFVW